MPVPTSPKACATGKSTVSLASGPGCILFWVPGRHAHLYARISHVYIHTHRHMVPAPTPYLPAPDGTTASCVACEEPGQGLLQRLDLLLPQKKLTPAIWF